MKIFLYNISLSFNKIKHSIYGYIVISVVLTLNLIIPAISVSHTSYISESKSIFPYSHGYYYYNWSGELFSQGELAKISKLYGDNTFIVSENIIDIDKQMIKVFASNKDVLDYMNFSLIDGDKNLSGNKVIADINFLRKMNLNLGDKFVIGSSTLYITGICNTYHRADILINYSLLESISTQTSFQQMTILPNLETYEDFGKLFLNDDDLYLEHNKGLLNDYIENWENSVRQSNIITVVFSVFLFLFGCISIFIIFKNKLISDYKDFAIMRCLGASNISVVTTYLADYAIIFMLSLATIILSFPEISKFFCISDYLVWNIHTIIMLTVISLLIMLVVGIYFAILITNKSLLQNLNTGEERNV